MHVIELSPYGFCGGVKRSLSIVDEVINNSSYPRPIYMLGSLVHNAFISEALKKQGIIILEGGTRLEMLEQVPSGTVIFSAHGISEQVVRRAREKNLTIVDTSCPYVNRSFDLIRSKINEGYTVIYIGKTGHPETEAALSIGPSVILVETVDDINRLEVHNDKLALTNQTTMSPYDIRDIVGPLKTRYPELEVMDAVCLSTKRRQDALYEEGSKADFVIVVGDRTSNNTRKLKDTCEAILHKPCVAIENVEDLNPIDLSPYQSIAITAGTSTPHAITAEIISTLKQEISKPYVTHLHPEDYLRNE